MKRGIFLLGMVSLFIFSSLHAGNAAEVLKMVIMASEDPKTEGPKYAALAEYLKSKIPAIEDIKLTVAKDYTAAANMFSSGQVNAMFSGSFVAAICIKKGVAVPVVRPVSRDGISTYKAVIIAPAGTPAVTGAAQLKGKKIAYSALASSGEIYARALIDGEAPSSIYTPIFVKNHEAAIRAVMSGEADLAVVKNLTYKDGTAFPGTTIVGSDSSENPNNTLIMTPRSYEKYGAAIEKALFELGADRSPAAEKVRDAFKIKAFIKTKAMDYSGTFNLISKAKINADSFDFNW